MGRSIILTNHFVRTPHDYGNPPIKPTMKINGHCKPSGDSSTAIDVEAPQGALGMGKNPSVTYLWVENINFVPGFMDDLWMIYGCSSKNFSIYGY